MAKRFCPISLVAIGDSNVGKTYLFRRFAYDEYTERLGKVEPEQIAYNWTIDVDGTKRNLSVYDTCGKNNA